jgi:S1-C subfamily serine protease
VSTADWVVIGVVVLSGLYGLASGFVRGAFSLAGFVLGAYLGSRIAPEFLQDGSAYAPLVALGGAILGGTIFRGLAAMLGGTLRAGLSAVPGLRALDSLAGIGLGAVAGVVLSWAVGAVLLYLPGQEDFRRAVQESTILSRINEGFPPERLLETLERVDPLGVLVGPPAVVPPPDSALARDPDVIAASKSVVRITGTACGLGIEGSGWIVRPRLVVTNAHVVAGIDRPRVDRGKGRSRLATVVAFDEQNDLAILRVPGLAGRALPFADPQRGAPVALVGYPENGPLIRAPGRLGATQELIGRDAYGRESARRLVTAIRGDIRPGSSGGPGIDARGRVRTTVFARRAGERGGYGIPADQLRAVLRRAGSKPVPATECAR